MIYNFDDTIASIATAVSNGGISIIRMSGSESLNVLSKIFSQKDKVFSAKSHTIHYGMIVDGDKKIDEVLVSIMLAPKTYTRENVVEINCHGGIVTTKKVLETCLKYGARLAVNGEFTKRAFLNGRIDLAESEAVFDLINSKTERQQEIFLNQLSGNLSNEIKNFREIILNLIATVEASIDYPEHDLEHDNIFIIKDLTNKILLDLEKLLSNSNKGKIILEGIETAIIGRPNVGKSSLINKLVGEEIAIVTEIAGTTRDILTEYINFNGIILKLIDTAGIRNSDDIIEQIGVKKTKEKVESAELILFLIDGSKEITFEDLDILNSIVDKNVIVIVNKSDLAQVADISKISNIISSDKIIFTSILNNNIDVLYNAIDKMFLENLIDNSNDNLVTNERHEMLLKSAINSLNDVKNGIDFGVTEDLLVIDLKDAYDFLGEIIGETFDDDIINKIFAQFCLGK